MQWMCNFILLFPRYSCICIVSKYLCWSNDINYGFTCNFFFFL